LLCFRSFCTPVRIAATKPCMRACRPPDHRPRQRCCVLPACHTIQCVRTCTRIEQASARREAAGDLIAAAQIAHLHFMLHHSNPCTGTRTHKYTTSSSASSLPHSMLPSRSSSWLSPLILCVLLLSTCTANGDRRLSVRYYHNTCPSAQHIVHSVMASKVAANQAIAPAVLRLFI
jgi:hypothetical protein